VTEALNKLIFMVSPAMLRATPVPEAVAALEIVIWVAESMLATTEPAGMPVPLTLMPTQTPTALDKAVRVNCPLEVVAVGVTVAPKQWAP
jgi:hypothetical protein